MINLAIGKPNLEKLSQMIESFTNLKDPLMLGNSSFPLYFICILAFTVVLEKPASRFFLTIDLAGK